MCPTLQEDTTEEAKVVGGFSGNSKNYNPYSNTYNPGWRDHSNFSYAKQPQAPPQSYGPPGFQQRQAPFPPRQQQVQAPKQPEPSLEELVRQMATNNIQFQQETRATINTLQNQVGQLATEINKVQNQISGKLPSQPEVNPRENASAVTLRSGKTLDDSRPPPQVAEDKIQKSKEVDEEGPSSTAPKVSIPNSLPKYITTAKTKIDVHSGTLSMEFGGNVVKFNIFDAMQYPLEEHSVFQLDVIDSPVNDIHADMLAEFHEIVGFLDSADFLGCSRCVVPDYAEISMCAAFPSFMRYDHVVLEDCTQLIGDATIESAKFLVQHPPNLELKAIEEFSEKGEVDFVFEPWSEINNENGVNKAYILQFSGETKEIKEGQWDPGGISHSSSHAMVANYTWSLHFKQWDPGGSLFT